MVHFSKLKLYGFKSFIDKTELDISPGLNGIVGPNGCGKSNLVEALRWVMGEKSAKNMRGGGMEDVIFAGTSKRPARNMAQAAIIIDNQDRTAPEPFNTASEIEITRTIERDKGSQYRVNGKAVRARDVYLLFADTMTGANSPALVSQGRITEIIVAKPQDRRRILEESAGVSGLHSRRHEAELRLTAAEQNLDRLNDVLRETKTRLSSLKRQARQAELYKELSAEIRRADMAIAWLDWTSTYQSIKSERASFDEANTHVQNALQIVEAETKALNVIESELPELRKEDMEARAVLQNFRVSLERLEDEIKHKIKNLSDAQINQQQITQDLDFVRNNYNEALSTLENIDEELVVKNKNLEVLPEQIEKAEENQESQKRKLAACRETHLQLTKDIAIATENRTAIKRQYETIESRIAHTTNALAKYDDQLATLKQEEDEIHNQRKNEPSVESLKKDLEQKAADKDRLNHKRQEFTTKLENLSNEKNQIEKSINTLEAESNALKAMLRQNDATISVEKDKSLLETLNVKKGYEKLTAAAFGQFLSIAGTDNTCPAFWSKSACNVTAFETYQSLADFVDGPKELNTFLNSVGVCEKLPEETPALSPGQILIAMDGAFMRWDGLVVKADAFNDDTSNSHLILEQKNRVAELSDKLTIENKKLLKITDQIREEEESLDTLLNQLKDLENNVQELQNAITQTMHILERLDDRTLNLTEKKASLSTQKEEKQNELTEFESEFKDLQIQYDQINAHNLDTKQNELAEIAQNIGSEQTKLDELTSNLGQLRYTYQNLHNDIENLNNKKAATEQDKLKYNDRIDVLITRLEDVDLQINNYTKAIDQDANDDAREALLNKISDQQTKVDQIAIALAAKDKDYKNVQDKLRLTEAEAATAREKRATAQANVANAESELQRIQSLINERFDLTPQALEEQTLSLFDNNLPHKGELATARDEAQRRRDAIGPVNLRAAIESEESERQLAEMESEHADLTKAISQLRSGITRLNNEARERLNIAFKRVDMHFKSLFETLFTGGKAYLEMIESDDPLESGLEIYAQPPGKSLQKLSLLSGGEQTLTATALIFAMFLTNPSPICVLDEIDAPLDDANVDRVCTLMETIARDTETRFIVITHHRMTMARMDRLYGVTMSERGVSQLVSVDMALQEELSLEQEA